ncbi:MAG: DUF5615 family PIN-like protein [Desulfococcaceae bacterium]
MKILLDTCVWGGVYKELAARGYDVVWTGLWETDPGDAKILDTAFQENRILITLDKDFGELAVLHGMSHCGILRLVNLAAKEQVTLCLYILNNYHKELEAGCILTAEHGRVRIRLND